jgi:hypothetical protein
MRWVALAALSCVACVGPAGDRIAFPGTGPTDPPANTDSFAEAPGTRVRFETAASVADVDRTACALRPTITVSGKARKVDLRIDGSPCAIAEAGAIRVDLAHQGRVIVLEVEVPPDATTSERDEMEAGLKDTARELARRVRVEAHTTFAPAKEKTDEKQGHRRSNRVFLVSGILWGSTALVGIPGAIMLGDGLSQRCCNDTWLAVAGGSMLLLGTAMPFLAAFFTTVAGTVMYVNDD